MIGLTAASLLLAGVGTATSVYGQVKAGQATAAAGKATEAAANDQAELDLYNAKVADLQAKDAIERGAEEENRFRTEVRGAIGAQRAAIAGNNVDVSYGSAVDVQADAARLGELDALTIRTNAARESWGYSVQAEDLRREADITRKSGANAAAAARSGRTAAFIGAGTTALTGASSLLKAKYGFK